MSTKLLRTTALAAACAVMMTAMCSCGDEKGEMRADYVPNSGHNNNNVIVTPDSGNYCEETNDAAECETWKPAENVSPDEDYKGFIEAGFKDPKAEPLSTFSVDVDTASYSNVRRMLEDGNIVPEDAVRAEEFINYFDYDYPDPEEGRIFGDYVELADCPWNSANKIMMIGIQGKRLEQKEAPPSNLVFLIDSSGSMSSYNKLPLVQNAFSILAEQLGENDRISIVTYAGDASVRLKGASGKNKDDILEALYGITASGGTNGEGGINKAYELAEKYFIEGGNNRVILATDGDLNIGASSEDELVKLIKSKRDNGIYLSVLGFGTGNYKDDRLEAVADNGNGNYSYIDSVDEAYRVLVQEMAGTLYTIAKDVKIQVEFNPSRVKSYRLIGYDNRLMNAEDFYDTTKDAGEVGAGHSVTALYEVELAETGDTYRGVPLEFSSEHTEQPAEDNGRKELCKLSVTYKPVDTEKDVYESQLFGMEKYNEKPSESIKLASAAAEFAMLLKNSKFKGDSSFGDIIKMIGELEENEKAEELSKLVFIADRIYR
ncbi:vWA domain-containing protein [Ruminococcus flavefaciens]|uniref:Ca-activated chloride channel family protein n=1 Tax=Ruminococcus flavefaciens TaxID=1265 RepID=A0A1M7M9M8_RUMFL|nr:VWA domain-containing protein [Ruminococcus flavefaciens]SHM87410.1 Ca-activated chloride channel family protein [Ruminococcus flavefaciens]